MSIEERFNAAVNVIRNLPKNGSYQPSNDMMLKFYSLFKQASEGPCTQRKPSFFSVVNRAKWEAWNSLGTMSRETAMQRYVDELKKIVETMSFTENVANFVGSIGELDNIDVNDLEMVAPEAMQHAKSRPDSPFSSRTTSPQRLPNGDAYSNSIESEDEFNSADEADLAPSRETARKLAASRPDFDPVLREVLATTDTMRQNLQLIQSKFVALEQNVIELKKQQGRMTAYRRIYPSWWPLKEISPKVLLFILVWPIVVNRLLHSINRKR